MYFLEFNDKTQLIVMDFIDALTTDDITVEATVEMLLLVVVYFALKMLKRFAFVEVDTQQKRVSEYHFIQNVKVHW